MEVRCRLIARYGTDANINNPSRIMRVPGFRHLKDPLNQEQIVLWDLTGGPPGNALPPLNYEEVTTNLPEAHVCPVSAYETASGY